MPLLNYSPGARSANPAFSVPSLLAVVAALGSFMTGAFLGTFLAIAAIVLGLVGALLAMSPRVRGGMLSLLSIAAGLIGIVAGVLKFVF